MIALAPVAALGAIIAALIALLLILGGKSMGQFVGQLVPDWHLPGLGSLRAAVMGAADAAVAAVTGIFDAAIGPIVDFITTPIRAFDAIFVKAIDTYIAVYQAINRIVTVRIPDAINGLRYWATVQWTLLYQYATALAEMIRAEYRAAVTAVEYRLGVAFAQLYAYATGLAELIRAEYRAAVAAEHAWASVAWAQLYRYATGLAQLVRMEFQAADAAIRSTMGALYADTLGRIARAEAAAEAYALAEAEAAAAHSVAVLEADARAAVSDVWGQLSAAAAAVEGVIATDFPDILADLRAIPADVPLSIAADIAAVGALSIPMLRYLERCGIPNCRNLGRFGHDLQELLGVVEGAGFLAFLVGMARDPAGTAAEVRDVLAPVADGVFSGARDLFGVG